MGEMNVGDKYEMDADMLATSNSNLGKQIVVGVIFVCLWIIMASV